MAKKKKTVWGETNSAPAQRQFTDREAPQESFVNALAEVNNREYSILSYYGVGGIGKSTLQTHLKEQYLDQDEKSIYSWIDFDTEANRTPHKALRTLARNFKQKSNINFPVFDIAYLIYWSKAFPDHNIKKDGLPFLEEGSQLAGVVNLFENSGGMIGTALNTLDYIVKKSKEFTFDTLVKDELKKLNALEAEEIEEKLILFFTYDIDTYKKKNSEMKVVIFFDTYEAICHTQKSHTNCHVKDEWIRDIISELTYVLFVICGREKIKWAEIDSEWEEDLNQHILGNLSADDARSFLESCKITDKALQNAIIQSSEGLPYYLDLCVDTFYQIKESGETPSAENFSNVEKEKIFERFMRYLSLEEEETLKVLANARFYTKELFTELIEKFKTGYPITAIYQLNNFSFISEDNGLFQIHDLMRKSLINFQNDELSHDVNTFLFEYYNSHLQTLDIKNITQESIEALPEAFYHKEQLGDVKKLDNWYTKPYKKFVQAAKYKTVLKLSIRLIDLQEEVLGEKHQDTATSYNNLAELYRTMGLYEKALQHHQKSCTLTKEVFGEEHQNTASSYNNQALLYEMMGEYEKALSYYQKSLLIREKVLGKEHASTATSYNNLAELYKLMGTYDKALSLYQKSLTIREKILGEKHPDTATSYNNLAGLYSAIDENEKALPLYQRALAIREKVLGEEHPDTAASYNNLATLYSTKGEKEKALTLYQKALDITENVLGEDHPDTAGSYNNLATLYSAVGEKEKALLLYQKALSIWEKVLGKDHPNTATSYTNIAVFYHSIGEYEKALPLLQKSLSIREEVLGVEHSSTTSSYNNLSILYEAMDDHVNAIKMKKQSLENKKKIYYDNQESGAIDYDLALYNLANNYDQLDMYNEALETYKEELLVLKFLRTQDQKKWHTDYLSTLNNIAHYQLGLKEFNNTILHYEEYFRLFDIKTIEKCEDISGFIYPYVKFYQAVLHTDDRTQLANIENIVRKSIHYFKEICADKYFERMAIEHTEYLPLKNSEDSFDNEKYEIFTKVFM